MSAEELQQDRLARNTGDRKGVTVLIWGGEVSQALTHPDRIVRDLLGADVDQDREEGSGEGRERWRGYQERRNKLEVLEFDRREVNARAFRQLRDVLNDEQETRLRMPAEPRSEDGG